MVFLASEGCAEGLERGVQAGLEGSNGYVENVRGLLVRETLVVAEQQEQAGALGERREGDAESRRGRLAHGVRSDLACVERAVGVCVACEPGSGVDRAIDDDAVEPGLRGASAREAAGVTDHAEP